MRVGLQRDSSLGRKRLQKALLGVKARPRLRSGWMAARQALSDAIHWKVTVRGVHRPHLYSYAKETYTYDAHSMAGKAWTASSNFPSKMFWICFESWLLMSFINYILFLNQALLNAFIYIFKLKQIGVVSPLNILWMKSPLKYVLLFFVLYTSFINLHEPVLKSIFLCVPVSSCH